MARQDGQEHDGDLVAIMRRLGDGDDAAVVTLYERYGGPIAASVQRVVRQRRRHVGRDDLDGLVFEVCFELASVAAGWSPDGGAVPWVWARHRVVNVVDRVLGPFADPLDPDRPALPDAPVDAGARSAYEQVTLLATLEHLVADLTSAELLVEALDRQRVSRRDRELWLEYAFEKHSGNRAPAATVAPMFAMTEESVRQAARRARHRLLALAARDERFAPLAALPLLA